MIPVMQLVTNLVCQCAKACAQKPYSFPNLICELFLQIFDNTNVPSILLKVLCVQVNNGTHPTNEWILIQTPLEIHEPFLVIQGRSLYCASCLLYHKIKISNQHTEHTVIISQGKQSQLCCYIVRLDFYRFSDKMGPRRSAESASSGVEC